MVNNQDLELSTTPLLGVKFNNYKNAPFLEKKSLTTTNKKIKRKPVTCKTNFQLFMKSTQQEFMEGRKSTGVHIYYSLCF